MNDFFTTNTPRLARWLLVLGLVCLGQLLWSQPAAAQISTGDGSWVWQHPLPQGSSLLGVWGLDANNVWAAGEGGAILKWDGASWSAQSSGTATTLRGVWGADANNVWAAGDNGTILKWDGTSWSPQSSGTTTQLNSVWGADANNVWAVGSSGTILKWDGASWSAQTSGAFSQLRGVWGADANNVWAVGQSGTILKWDGASWSTQTSGTTQTVVGVWGVDANNIWAVGSGGTILKWDGASWASQSSGITIPLNSVWGADANNIWAVGFGGTILKWDGASWISQTSGVPQTLNSVWGADANNVWTVGSTGAIVKWDGTSWSAQSSRLTTTQLEAVWAADANNVWAVGSTGTILKWDGTSWSAQSSGITSPLSGVGGTDANNVWAVGFPGTILKWDGASWNPQTSGSTTGLNRVWAADANNVWVVGRSGTILKWDGASWSPQSSGTTTELRGVGGADANNVWAVGDNGTILKWDGTSWSPQSSGTTARFYGVWGADANNAWAVGTGGTILKWDGASWSAQSSGTTTALNGVWGADANNVWAVGFDFSGGSAILKWDGTSWSPQASGTTNFLTSMWGADVNNVWAVGSNGTILKNVVSAPPANARINGSDCDLIDAITAANTDTATGDCAAGTSGADTIDLLDNVTLTAVNNGRNGLPRITSQITINGSGFTIARDPGAPAFRILEVIASGNLTLNATTISGGRSTGSPPFGGGLSNAGALTLNNSTVSNNFAGVGGGFFNSGLLTLNNSTISGNSVDFSGAAIGNDGSGTATLNNSTVSNNIGTSFDGSIFNNNNSETILNNSIVANSGVSRDCGGSTTKYTSLGHNLDTDGTCNLTAVGDIPNGVANLGPLQINAPGNTPTHALLPGSQAIDAAPSGLATDQRGVARPQGCAFDIGAFELEWSPVCNTPPVAVDDSYSTNEDSVLTVPAPGVLANDSDGDGNPLTAQPVTGPVNGTLLLNDDGSFTYTPDANFFGTDSFTYVANDGVGALGADSNVATVNLTINAVNDAPSAMDDSYSTNEDTPLTIAAPGLLGNDSDVEGNPLVAVQVSPPSNGNLTLNGDGSFTYTPNANFNGSDSFTYKANDGGADSTVATVNITVDAVNDAPVATADSYATDEDTVLNVPAPGVLANDSDVEGDALTAALVDAPLNGSLTLNADGSFSYTPNANFNGSDSFTYQVNDGMADSNVATVSLTVNAVNDAPVAANDSYLTDEDVPLTVPAPGVQDNDNDLDGDVLSSVVVSGPANGSVTLNGDGSFTYTPNQDYNGSDSFTYQVNDGAASSNVATVTIVIGGVNDAPVAVNDSYATDEDTVLNVPAPGVLSNDGDVDNDPLTIILVDAPLNGALTLNGDGSFGYTPDANFNGSDSFTYQLDDGAATSTVATVNITVNAVNDAPVATNDSYNTNEDVALTIAAPGLLGNDSDTEGDAFNALLVSGPANGSLTLNGDGSFSYTPNANFNGSDSFSYQVNDGQVNSNVATVALTIVAVNDPPVAGNDSYSTNEDTPLSVPAPGVLGNDSDPVEGSPVTAVLVSGPANGSLTLNADGSFSYTPNANYSGSDSFTYRANDGSANSNIATVSITVISASDLIDTLTGKVQALVDSGALSGPKSNPLINGLNNAQKHLMKGQTSQAIKKLEDFIKDVNGLVSRGELTAAQGQELVNDANAIIAALN